MSSAHPPIACPQKFQWSGFLLLAILAVGVLLFVLRARQDENGAAAAARSDLGNVTARTDQRVPQESELAIAAAGKIPTGISAAAPKAETLTGEGAKEELRKSGQYESLGAALQAARYAAERIDPSGPHSRGAEYFAANPGQQLRAWFGRDGIELASGRDPAKDGAGDDVEPWSVALRLRAAGRDGSLEPVSANTSSFEGNRVELGDPATAITQWFENREEGIEQGFTLSARPKGEAREVALLLGIEGTLQAEVIEGQQSVRFVNSGNTEVLHYSGLRAWDATGRALPSRLELRGANLAFLVSDVGARYPITVDPLFANAEARLREDSDAGGLFGRAVALSGDTALIGADTDGNIAGLRAGSAYVFVRSGTKWNQQTKLTASDGRGEDQFGHSVALSGNTALIGAVDAGSAYVFVRSGTSWSQQAQLIDGAPYSSHFGNAVALSGDTALIGAYLTANDGVRRGTASVFVRNDTSWTEQAKLTAGRVSHPDDAPVGVNLALSGDTALIGTDLADAPTGKNAGSAYVFVRTGTSWSQQVELFASDGTPDALFGNSVALSGDTALIAAPHSGTPAGSYVGSAYVFVRSGTSWSQQAKLADDDLPAGSTFGRSLALSGDTALIGALDDAGSAYVFVRSGTSWSQQAKLADDDLPAGSIFGRSLALSGNAALIGALDDAGSAYVFVRTGVTWTQQAKLTLDDERGWDSFGNSVALSGATALIGVIYDNTPAGPIAGSAYVFVRNGASWSREAKLTADDGAADQFGRAVALSGDTALIGAFGHDNNIGRAFVFVRSGVIWSQQARLTGSDGHSNDSFGSSVALDGETALIGAPFSNTSAGEAAGSAYVFVRSGTTWTEQARLTPDDGAISHLFGNAVAVSADTALIGEHYRDTAYVFARSGSTWTQQAKLTASDGTVGMGFGRSVAVSGDTALVGAYSSDPGDEDGGGAYVFVRSGTSWQQEAKLVASDSAAGEGFGSSVALSGDTALIGANGYYRIGVDPGSAYIFLRSGTSWNQQAKLTAGLDGSPYDQFGCSVALSGGIALVGASYSGIGIETGTAYIFLIGQLPEITVQPVSRTVAPGPDVTVTFSVTAIGYAPLRYKWRKNGFEIEGANASSYTIAAVAEGDAGSYDVIVSNVGGTATSAAAALAMLAVNALSQFTQDFPDAPPAAQGFVLVNLGPAELLTAPGIRPAWRFVGEQEWRLPGVPVGGLATGDRQIEFRPVPGYLHPLRESVSVISGAAATVLEREYYDTEGGTTGGLSVTLKPAALAYSTLPVAERARWRLLGQDDGQWQDTGATLAGLVPGNYLVECKPISGRAAPPPIAVPVLAGETRVATATYFIENAPIGTLPDVLPFETVSTSEGLPYAFVGQLRSDIGVATGFVVKPRVVATAAHAVFDEGTLSYATGTQWLFQRDRGTYEPKPQIPRGFYLFDGYATQRAAEGTPGESSPESQNLDVAAVYFLEDAGRGGSSGYLGSDADDNEWLLSSELKILAGYPVDGIAPEFQGRMHATPPANVQFARAFGRTFTTADITTTGGASGGPLCVRYDDGKYYPAAIYLGGTTQTVVRAIDRQVIELFELAEFRANGDENHTSQGTVHVDAPTSGTTFSSAQLKVMLSPSAVVEGGARWRIGKQGTPRESGVQLDSLSPGNYTIHFTPVLTYKTPPPLMVTLTAGFKRTIEQPYEAILPPTITSPNLLRVVRGKSLSYTLDTTAEPTQFIASGFEAAGISFNPATGMLSGAPGVDGIFKAIVVAQNESGSSGPFELTIIVAEPGELVIRADATRGSVAVQPKRTDNIFAQGEEVVLQAIPYAPEFVFAGWEFAGATASSLTSTSTSFVMGETVVATANFIPNPFFTRFGGYHGLLMGDNGLPSGMVTGSVTRLGRFSLKLQLGASHYTLAGQLDAQGNFAGEIVRPGSFATPIVVQLDLSNAEPELGGTLTVDGETVSFSAARADSSRTNPSPAAGRYTLVLPADPSQSDPLTYPSGHGYWTVNVNALGMARASGHLGDGQPFSLGGVIGNDLRWAVYARPYLGEGLLGGMLSFVAQAPSAAERIDGTLSWQKPPSIYHVYFAGFTGSIVVEGSRYRPPAPGVAALEIRDWNLVLGRNVLTEPMTATAKLNRSNRFILTGSTSPEASLRLDPATGLLAGRFTPLGFGSVKFKGVLLQAERVGRGVVLLPRRPGLLTLDPPPLP